MLKKNYVLFFILFSLIQHVFAQKHAQIKQPYEISAGLGISSFLGELGGGPTVARGGIRDLDLQTTKPAFYLGVRYHLIDFIALKGSFTSGWVSGSDKFTTNKARHDRNLSFRSPIIELSAQAEFSFLRERAGNIYVLPDGIRNFLMSLKSKIFNLKSEAGQHVASIHPFKLWPYAFAGIGVFYFNPKTQYNGSWVALQPLCTEGQGIDPYRKKYKRIGICIPFGIGTKFKIDKLESLKIDFGIRKTFTDYIDDVSTTYYDKDALKSKYGQTSADLSDRSNIDGFGAPNQQRGDPNDRDWYIFSTISYCYKIGSLRKRIRPKY